MTYQPRGRHFEEFKVGETFQSQGRTINPADVSNFAGVTADFNPLHTDEEFAKRTQFGGRIAHGLLTLGISGGQQNQLGRIGTGLAAIAGSAEKFCARRCRV